MSGTLIAAPLCSSDNSWWPWETSGELQFNTAANVSFVHREWKKCSKTKCLILCLDVLIEDSNYLKEDKEDKLIDNDVVAIDKLVKL